MVGERRSPFQKYFDQIKNLKEELKKKRDKELEKRDKDIIKLKKRDKEIEELQERLNQLEKKITAPSAQAPVTSPQSQTFTARVTKASKSQTFNNVIRGFFHTSTTKCFPPRGSSGASGSKSENGASSRRSAHPK